MIMAGLMMTAAAVGAPHKPITSQAIVGPGPVCPNSIGAMVLPEWVDKTDGRLQSKQLIVVLKGVRRIFLMSRGSILHIDSTPACWGIGLGFSPVGHKQKEGDGKTPEGWYSSSDKPWSSFYAAIAVHYPSATDTQKAVQSERLSAETAGSISRALQAGKKPPQKTPLGGEILIHGGGAATDWTLGCVAMEDKDIDQLRSQLPEDMVTEVLILP